MKDQGQQAFTGRKRERRTRPSVHLGNKVAAAVITIGGTSTVIAVMLVFLFLVAVALPIFLPPRVSAPERLASGIDIAVEARPLRFFAVNEYQTMLVAVTRSGELVVSHLRDGAQLLRKNLFGDRRPNDVRFLGNSFVAGFADGSIQTGKLEYTTSYLGPGNIPERIKPLVAKQTMAFREGVLEQTPENQYRLQTLTIALNEPAVLEEGTAIERVDISFKNDSPVVAAISSSGTLHLKEINSRYNMLTGKTTLTLYGGSMAVPGMAGNPPDFLRLAGLGDNVFLAWRDGRLLRVDSRRADEMRIVENINLLRDGSSRLTLLEFLVGKTSLVAGDDSGNVSVWFRIKPADGETTDGAVLVRAHDLEPLPGTATSFCASRLSRQIAVADDRGHFNLYYVTNQRTLERLEEPRVSDGIMALAMSPKDDGLVALTDTGIFKWALDIPHPEINLQQVFGKVWYEGYNEPAHVWQSSSGTDDFEPKYGLMPIIFGTLKATLVSMLIGLPLAIMAAVYTSEVMKPRLRSVVKPAIEMMASLPSVVLGFLAALVIAPAVESHVPALMASFVLIPFSMLLGAHLWQLLSHSLAAKIGWVRLPGMLLMLWFGIKLSAWSGPVIERYFFLGDIKLWLSTREGGAAGGWLFLLVPVCGVAVIVANARWVTPTMKTRFAAANRMTYVLADLVRFLLSSTLVFFLAWAISTLLSAMGLDARGGYIDTYVQRNALIVGFVMGFAVIPIIYTLCEDALDAVPETLRAASLGAGATPWQTARRIIIPTAASGFFSAAMIGFGRAVGETMIVLMAAGNTALMEWNIFNGFRTLSANIAVELPEAVKDSTHYRMLYLAALTLFVMTFVLNSVAEVVRQRFRKRAFEL